MINITPNNENNNVFEFLLSDDYEKLIINIGVNNYTFYFVNTLRNDEIKHFNDSDFEGKEYTKKNYVLSIRKEFKNKDLPKNTDLAFCNFRLTCSESSIYNDRDLESSGVYAWVQDNKVIYIGKTQSLVERFNLGYGQISPRNIYVGGQSTNCRMNRFVLNSKSKISIYFLKTNNSSEVEKEVLNAIKKNDSYYWNNVMQNKRR